MMLTLPPHIGGGTVVYGELEGLWATRAIARDRFEVTQFRAELLIYGVSVSLGEQGPVILKDVAVAVGRERFPVPGYLKETFGSVSNRGTFDFKERSIGATVGLQARIPVRGRSMSCRVLLRTLGVIGRGGVHIAAGFGIVLSGPFKGTIMCCAGPRREVVVKPAKPITTDGPPPPPDITGDIKIDGDKPASAVGEIKDNRPTGTVKVAWKLNAPCAAANIKVKQEIKGYIEEVPVGGGPNFKVTAHSIVEKNVAGIKPGDSTEVDDFRKDTGPDKSETEFGPDLSAKGSSTYPDDLISKDGKSDGSTDVTLKDDPGTSARVGAVWKEIHVRLTFRTTVFCGDKQIGQFIWHVKYDLPGGAPDVGLGEIK